MYKEASLDLNKYKKIEKIGNGSFGKVYRIQEIETGKFYAAKKSYNVFDLEDKHNDQLLFLYREIKILSGLNYPTVIRFIGFSPTDFNHSPKFTIITEYVPNKALKDIIECENRSTSPPNWDQTRKLICIYGIASGMSYLHKNNIIHRDLKTDNILLDEYLCPKIADFGLSKQNKSNSKSLQIQSQFGQKGTPLYWAPEIFSSEKYSKATDVYAFSIVVFEIMTCETPYKNMNIIALNQKVLNNDRPIIPEFVPAAYRDLIEKCWSQNPEDRPTFDEIVFDLKNNSEFITDLTDQNDFLVYVDFLENYKSTFDMDDSIHFDDFIKNKVTGFQRMSIKIENEKIVEFIPENQEEIQEEIKNDDNEIKLFPFDDFEDLDESCKKIVKDAEKSSQKKFVVGKNLIEGKAKFPLNLQLGIKYLQKSRAEGNDEAKIYLAKLFVEGKVVPTDLDDARKFILEIESREEDGECLFLLGKIEKKEKNYLKAINYFKKASKYGNAEAMFYYGKMLMNSYEGIEKDEKTATKYFELANKNGCTKSYKPKEIDFDDNKSDKKDDIENCKKDDKKNGMRKKIPTWKFQVFFISHVKKTWNFQVFFFRVFFM